MARPDGRPDKPGAPGYRITTLTAFLAVDKEDGSEGVMATSATGPMIGADDARVMQYRPIAQAAADMFGIEVKLARFTVREDIDTINPKREVGKK